MPAETFWTLLHSLGHWEFEIFLMVVFDGLVGALLWPFASKHIKHHLLRDRRELIADNTGGFVPVKYRWEMKAVYPLTFDWSHINPNHVWYLGTVPDSSEMRRN